MPNFDVVLNELREERLRLEVAIRALSSLKDGSRPNTRTRRTMSAAARARIAAAQRARWARRKVSSKATHGPARPKRQISAAGLARIRAAQRARWAKIKRAKK
jgi:hypothetical protein